MINNVSLTPVPERKKQAQQTRKCCSFFGNTPAIVTGNVKAVNTHGDSLNISSGNNPSGYYAPQPIYPVFKIPVQTIKNKFISAIDGLLPYGAGTPQSWQGFPQRNSYHDAPGFRHNLTLNGNHTFNKGIQNGCIDYHEKELATNQLAYDASLHYPQGTAEHNAALNGLNLLNSIFQGPVYMQAQGLIRPEFDKNRNGKFDAYDVEMLAMLDGDPHTLSSDDLNIASTNFIMKKRF